MRIKMADNKTYGFLGAGNMAQALAKGMIDSGVIKASNVLASAPTTTNLKKFEEWGASVTHDNSMLADRDVVFLCVKPHLLESALSTMTMARFPLFISVAAGITLKRLDQLLLPLVVKYKEVKRTSGSPFVRVVRMLVNTACLVKKGVCVFSKGPNATADDINLVTTIMEPLGYSKEVPESYINYINGITGSGIAFAYTFLEALSDGGVNVGVPRPLATELSARMVEGAARMVLESGKHLGQLKDDVCSPGGTTICGIHELEKGAFRGSVMNAVIASSEKCKDLAKN